MILIITNKSDVTTDLVVYRLNQLGIPYYRLNTEELTKSFHLVFDFSLSLCTILDLESGNEYDIKMFKSIYFRRPKLPEKDFSGWSHGEIIFFNREINTVWDGFYHCLDEKFWINNVFSVRNAENKIFQQMLARTLGFKIPDGKITSSVEILKEFTFAYKNCIAKSIKTGLIDDSLNPRIIYTNRINSSDFERLNQVSSCPTYFQEEIEKELDIRVTIVGRKCFPVAIDSQSNKDSKTDWRKAKNTLLHKPINIPKDVESKCFNLLKHLNLNFAAIDLIFTKNKEYVFLEINPNGQWGWIESLTGYPISTEIVHLLNNPGV